MEQLWKRRAKQKTRSTKIVTVRGIFSEDYTVIDHLLVVRRRVSLRPSCGVPVRLPPLEALRRELVRRETARPRSKAARDHDRLLPVPLFVVRHYPGHGTSTADHRAPETNAPLQAYIAKFFFLCYTLILIYDISLTLTSININKDHKMGFLTDIQPFERGGGMGDLKGEEG